jgi:probable phosphoglycerate mutase
MRILFVRHGEPDYAHDCLTPLGAVQAKAAAERLSREGIERIYTSPMGRAMATARETADRLGMEPETLDFMHELYWGSTDGTPVFSDGHPWNIADELARQGWDLTDKSWPEHPFFRNNRVTEEAAKVARGIDGWLASLGYIREGPYYRCEREDDRQLTVALFSHGGSSSAAIARILNLPFPYVCALFHMPFTSVTAIRLDRHPGSVHSPVLELTGDSRHIEGLTV